MTTSAFFARLPESKISAIHDALVSSGFTELAEWLTRKQEHSLEEEKLASLARGLCNDELEVDDDPVVSLAEGGAWVAAWLWVAAPAQDSSAA
jgi:hypothetical protein